MPRRTLLLLALFAFFLNAQEFRSTLTGKVTDSSGASVVGATIAATESSTNSKFGTVTNAEGLYTIPLLPPGAYSLTADASGFKRYVQSGIQIGSDTRVGQDIVLTIGSAGESVTVTSDAPQL